MAVICPTVTAFDTHEYRAQIERLVPFADRIHIDLMDGQLAPTVSPDLSNIWLPDELNCDVHLMYQHPMEQIEALIKLQPHMVVIHAEAEVDHAAFAEQLHQADIFVGLALLQDTDVDDIYQMMQNFDQVLIFSGDLGKHGGVADLELLQKVRKVREHHPTAEVAWDGGINAENAKALIEGGVDVLNVGGFIQKSEDPGAAYAKLTAIDEAS